jgi:hypothetical protein
MFPYFLNTELEEPDRMVLSYLDEKIPFGVNELKP